MTKLETMSNDQMTTGFRCFLSQFEAGKKAATRLLQLQKQIIAKLIAGRDETAEEIARSIDAGPQDVFHVLRHLARNDPKIGVTPGEESSEDQFSLEQ
jgi:hypothetical protein